MIELINYLFKVDKNGRKYALRKDEKTGKHTRINYKLAQRRNNNLIYNRKKTVEKEKVIDKIKETGAGGTYTDYIKAIKNAEKELIAERKRTKQPPLTKKEIKKIINKKKAKIIEHKIGIRSYFKYAWTYTQKIYYEDDNGNIKYDCDTNVFMAGSRAFNGDHFNDFIDLVREVHDTIPDKKDLCTLDGGACVTLYYKSNKELINKFELGKGCGFSFDFKNYDNDNENTRDDGRVDI